MGGKIYIARVVKSRKLWMNSHREHRGMVMLSVFSARSVANCLYTFEAKPNWLMRRRRF